MREWLEAIYLADRHLLQAMKLVFVRHDVDHSAVHGILVIQSRRAPRYHALCRRRVVSGSQTGMRHIRLVVSTIEVA